MKDRLPLSRGDRYAIAALKNRRAEIASEIVQLQHQLRHRKDSLMYVDATLRILDPSIAVDRIPNKRLLPQRVRFFKQGELGRLIVGTIRKAEREMGIQEIATTIVGAKGYGKEAQKAMAQRVRSNLAYLVRRGLVVKSGNGNGARWRLGDAL